MSPRQLAAKELRAAAFVRVTPRAAESRRPNVGSFADSEVLCAGAHHRKSPDAGKLLEAATGVEPVMEVLQTSVGRAQG